MRRSLYKSVATMIVGSATIIGVWVVILARGERLKVALLCVLIISVMIGFLRRMMKVTEAVGGFSPEDETDGAHK